MVSSIERTLNNLFFRIIFNNCMLFRSMLITYLTRPPFLDTWAISVFELLASVPVPCLPASLVLCGSWNKLCIFTSLFIWHSSLLLPFLAFLSIWVTPSCISSLLGLGSGVFSMPPLHPFLSPPVVLFSALLVCLFH